MKLAAFTRFYWRPVEVEPEIDARYHQQIALGEGHAAGFRGWAIHAACLETGGSVSETPEEFVLLPEEERLLGLGGPWAVYQEQEPGPAALDGSFEVLARWYGIGPGGLHIGYPRERGYGTETEARSAVEAAFRRAFERAWDGPRAPLYDRTQR